MDQNVRYVIGEIDGDAFPLDRAGYRAFFYWQAEGVEHQRSFSVKELEAHIQKCKARGEPTMVLEVALKRLRVMNR